MASFVCVLQFLANYMAKNLKAALRGGRLTHSPRPDNRALHAYSDEVNNNADAQTRSLTQAAFMV